jgi:two-component system sensor histidine kinase PilS (NtrC family)
LLLARLVLTAVSFAIGVGLEVPGGELTEAGRVGLFWTMALSFGATAISATVVRRVRHLQRFAAFQLALDVGIVTALVHFSGGPESLFVFLYVLVTVYGALLFERWGALAAATLSAVCYAGVLWGVAGGLAAGEEAIWAPAAAVWGVHVGALYAVGALASVLSRELQRTGQALDRRTEDLLRLRNLHERTVESIMSGLLTTDRSGRITYFNPEAELITGMTVREAVGQPLDAVIPGAADLILEPRLREQDSHRARMRFRNRSGGERHLGLAGSILWDEEGAAAGHVLIFQDVTEVVAMEQQLRQSERLAAVGEMSANMAHEIRNPLAAISGSVQVLRAGLKADETDPEHDRLMQIVVREADRLSGLIQDFLHYARPRSPNCQPVLLDDLVEDVARLIESSLPKAVSLRLELGSEVFALGDPGQLEQVLWNLCLNASQAMPEGGELRLEVRQACEGLAQGPKPGRRRGDEGSVRAETLAPGWAEIVVSDTGVGIPFEVLQNIFEPFFTTKKEGSGLGLSTVHRIVESHGGRLQVDSEEGRGTTFRVCLPRTKERP